MPRSVREQVILRVAGQVFAEGGYERASMDRIAGLAGVSKPMLYADRADGAHPPTGRLRAVINEFLAFVEEHSDGWTVLFRELSARRPLAEQVARLRSEIVGEVQRMLEGQGDPSWVGLRAPASEGVAEAIVGAGEALANWWLKKPDVRREDVAEWYVGLARAAISTAVRDDG
jgi:hypothetical protein